MTDDRPFGGGPGMIMKPEPLTAAVESVQTESVGYCLSPSGAPLINLQRNGWRIQQYYFVCGHYEGVDERVIELWVDEDFDWRLFLQMVH